MVDADEPVIEENFVGLSISENKDKISKSKRKKEKKKRAKERRLLEKQVETNKAIIKEPDNDIDIEVQFVPETDPEELKEPHFRQFRRVFDFFRITEKDSQIRPNTSRLLPGGELDKFSIDYLKSGGSLEHLPLKARAALLAQQNRLEEEEEMKKEAKKKAQAAAENSDPSSLDPSKLSKKKLKKMTRLSVAALKTLVARPDVVEMHDVCARDPKLLIHLKSYRNTVPVPRHWCAKRKYLQGKRGIEKPPFRLPDFITATGIMEMRQTIQDVDAEKSLKTKMREKIRPKVGKIDIDYQKLHDAFFKYQTKPKLSGHGDLYYEGKEFEVRLKEKKPGTLSDELKTALGMPLGPSGEKFPPPWLIAMQRYGPPPSYPNLKIPGLNAPIPEGCSFGYHAGGWGKPPVDEYGKPLYGDVFGHGTIAGSVRDVYEDDSALQESALPEKYWGELESDEDESSSEEEDENSTEEGEEDEGGEMGLVTPAAGLVTPGGLSSVTGGMASSLGGGVTSSGMGLETPQSIELRKRQQLQSGAQSLVQQDTSGGIKSSMSSLFGSGEATPQLYKVVQEKTSHVKPNELMGSSKVYDVSGASINQNLSAPNQSVVQQQPTGSTSTAKRKRAAPGTESGKESGAASSGAQSSGSSAAKKYKDFKF